MKVAPLFGGSIAGKSYPVSRQRRVNCYYENRSDGDKAKVVVYGTPGLVQLFTMPNSAPVRGMLGTESALYAVSGNQFYSLSGAGASLYSATLGTVSGFVSIANSPTQLVVVDGTSGYLFQNGALAQINSPGFPTGARTVTFVSSYFVCEQPGTQQFWVSNVFDGSTWNALGFASASQYSDNLKAVDSLTGNLILFSENHVEFWQNVGTIPEPFAPLLAATSEWGLSAIWSRAHLSNSLIFLSKNRQGTPQVVRIEGYSLGVISTPDLDSILQGFSTVSDAVALTYVVNGHPMYQLTFPTANRSFLYDASTGLWSEVQTGLTADYASRHTGNLSGYYASKTLISDYATGSVYTLSDSAYTDNGTTILREIVTRHKDENFNVLGVDELYLDMETGVGLNSGQGVSPVISIECSKDNGRTFGTPRTFSLGAMGNYRTRVVSRRWGSSRDFVFRIRMTDPVKFAITEGALVLRSRPQ